MTPEQRAVIEVVKRWLKVREATGGRDYDRDRPPDFSQLCADIDHSALLNRLLEGKEAFPQPPPKAYSYPWYDLVEYGYGETTDVWEPSGGGSICIGQNPEWELVRKIGEGHWHVRHPGAPGLWSVVADPCHERTWVLTRISK